MDLITLIHYYTERIEMDDSLFFWPRLQYSNTNSVCDELLISYIIHSNMYMLILHLLIDKTFVFVLFPIGLLELLLIMHKLDASQAVDIFRVWLMYN